MGRQERGRKLSQGQVDALVATTPRGETPPAGGVVRIYDFRSGIRFSKEQLWSLEMMHENLAKRLSSALSVGMRTKVQVSLAFLNQGTYSNLVADMPRPTLAGIVNLQALGGHMLLEIRPDLAALLIERLLGGRGLLLHRPREYTDLELALVRRVMVKVLEDVQVTWERIIRLQAELEDLVLDPHFAPVALPSDAAVYAVFEVRFDEGSGTLSLTIPYPVLEPIAPRLNSRLLAARVEKPGDPAGAEHQQRMRGHLAGMPVPVTVRLGGARLPLKEIRGLERGDIIVLDARTGDSVQVFVGGRIKFRGRPGRHGQILAVRIEAVVEESSLPAPEPQRPPERRELGHPEPSNGDRHKEEVLYG